MNMNIGATQALQFLSWQFVKKLSRENLMWRLQWGEKSTNLRSASLTCVQCICSYICTIKLLLHQQHAIKKKSRRGWRIFLMPSFSNSVIPNQNKSTYKSVITHLNPTGGQSSFFYTSQIYLYLQHLCKQTQPIICQGGMGSSIIQISHTNTSPPPGFCCFQKVLFFVTGTIHHCCNKDSSLPAS